MRIHIGSDHAGLELKGVLINHLLSMGHDVSDHGPFEYDALDDYPVFCIPTAQAVAANPDSLGIVLGGSATANKSRQIKSTELELPSSGARRRLN